MKSLVTLFVGAAAVLATSAAVEPQETSVGRIRLIPVPESAIHHRVTRDPRIRETEVEGTSTNWSGYAVESDLANPASGVVSDVKGTWIVPTAQASTSAHTYSSNWVGIDGYSSGTVEQLGTESDWNNGQPTYYAWIEMYPKRAYLISGITVHGGDTITAEVQVTGRGKYLLTMRNVTTNQTFSSSQKAGNTKNSSAEWVVEAPHSGGVLPLADFGTTSFSACSATLGGHAGAINDTSWQFDRIDMVTSSGDLKDQTSTLNAAGDGFTVTWKHE